MKKLFRTSLLLLGLGWLSNLPAFAQWSTTTLSQARLNMAIATVQDKALFAGGEAYNTSLFSFYPSNRVDIYNGKTNQWTTATLSAPRMSMGVINVNNLVFFAGGQSADAFTAYRGIFSNVDIYNAETASWTTAQLSEPRSNVGVASIGDKVFFAAGKGSLSTSTAVDIYNITTNQWSVTKLPAVLDRIGLVSVGKKLIGWYADQIDAYYTFDATTDQWITRQSPTIRRNVQVVTVGHKAIFAGGDSVNSQMSEWVTSNQVDIYDADTDQWTTAQLSQTRANLTSISVGNKAFFAGGTNNSNIVDIYDATTNQWTVATLSQGRSNIVATSIGDQVLFAGGNGSGIVDIYDTSTNQWSTTQLPQVRQGLTAVHVNDKALFIENVNQSSYTPNRIDIYSTNAALPVNFVSFTGEWIESMGTQLNWQTSWETNSDYFQIQRSRDAKSFETIGRVAGKGTTSERTDYSFIDPGIPDPVNYYRLRQVDLDGSVHLSKIISVNRQETKQPAQLTVWPSPTTGALTIQLSAGVTAKEVTIYDLHGRKLRSQTASLSTTDVSGLQTGAYILDVLTDDGQHVRSRFVRH